VDLAEGIHCATLVSLEVSQAPVVGFHDRIDLLGRDTVVLLDDLLRRRHFPWLRLWPTAAVYPTAGNEDESER
jgi:hypothetical protein